MIESAPRLFYQPACPPCRWMSRLVVMLSLGVVRRVAVDGEEARQIHERYPDSRGQILLIDRGRVTFGRRVFAALPLAVLSAPARALLSRAGPGGGRPATNR